MQLLTNEKKLTLVIDDAVIERVLFDVNVILDVLENRQPHVSWSGPALELAATGHVKGFIAASSVDTLASISG